MKRSLRKTHDIVDAKSSGHIESMINQFERTYYLCANRYFDFIAVHPNAHSSATLPCEKFNGIVSHFFDILSRQSTALSHLVTHLDSLGDHQNRFVSQLALASRFDPEFSIKMRNHEMFVEAAESARNLLEQTDGFFQASVASFSTSGVGDAPPSILKSFAAVREDFDQFRVTIRDRYPSVDQLEFAFEKKLQDKK